MTLTNGIHQGVTREAYDRIERTNWSKLKHMKRSPFHFRAALTEKAIADTEALIVGRACHVATLEPERFRSSYAIWDGGTRRGKEWDKFKEKHADVEILKAAHYEQVTAVSQAVLSNEHGAKYFRNGSAEVTVLWTHVAPDIEGCPGFAIDCKGRVDFTQDAIVDLKTTRDASPDAFGRQCWNLDYYGQAAFYVDGYAAATGKRLPYIIVAVETGEPHAVQVYRVPDRMLETGRELYRGHLEKLNECRLQNRWPGYAEGELELQLPRWMQQQEDTDVSGLGLEFEEEVHA